MISTERSEETQGTFELAIWECVGFGSACLLLLFAHELSWRNTMEVVDFKSNGLRHKGKGQVNGVGSEEGS